MENQYCVTCKTTEGGFIKYSKKPNGKQYFMCNKCHAIRMNIYYHKNKAKHNTRQKVWNGIRDGKLERLSCRVCKSNKAEAHHKDYDKPLEVIWLCKEHHSQVHWH